jgi:hypothetical protein
MLKSKSHEPKRVLALTDLKQANRAAARVQSHGGPSLSDPPRTAQYAPATINLRLAVVRRVAYEAADAGLLSPELTAGIRRVEGVRRLDVD